MLHHRGNAHLACIPSFDWIKRLSTTDAGHIWARAWESGLKLWLPIQIARWSVVSTDRADAPIARRNQYGAATKTKKTDLIADSCCVAVGNLSRQISVLARGEMRVRHRLYSRDLRSFEK